MNNRERQLRERDVRKLAPELDADNFMQNYVFFEGRKDKNFIESSKPEDYNQSL